MLESLRLDEQMSDNDEQNHSEGLTLAHEFINYSIQNSTHNLRLT